MILILGKEGLKHRTGKEIQNVFQHLFKQRGKWRREAAELDKYYTVDASHATNSRKMIVVMVDGKRHQGGMADRIRGIVSAYSVAKEMGLDFRIHFVSPFPLTDYLVPNLVDWRISEQELCFNSHDAEPMFCGSNATHVEPFFQKRWFKKRYRHCNKQLHVYTNAHLLRHGDSFKRLFHELFKPTEPLQKALTEYEKPLKGGFYSMTFRFQQLLGDFKEENFVTLSATEQEELKKRCVDQIVKTYNSLREKKPVLLTADSRSFLDYASSRLDFVYVVPGTVAHMDWTTDISFEQNLKSFVDFMMISHADKAFLLQTGKMYNSGFPRRAAQAGGVPFRHIRF